MHKASWTKPTFRSPQCTSTLHNTVTVAWHARSNATASATSQRKINHRQTPTCTGRLIMSIANAGPATLVKASYKTISCLAQCTSTLHIAVHAGKCMAEPMTPATSKSNHSVKAQAPTCTGRLMVSTTSSDSCLSKLQNPYPVWVNTRAALHTAVYARHHDASTIKPQSQNLSVHKHPPAPAG
jgi:hypothetical protein